MLVPWRTWRSSCLSVRLASTSCTCSRDKNVDRAPAPTSLCCFWVTTMPDEFAIEETRIRAEVEKMDVAFCAAMLPQKLDQHQRQEAIERLAKGESLVDVARTYGVAPTTIGRLPSPFAENVAA
jgi:hypothetical protein